MVGLGFVLTFGGYSLFVYGLSQIRGQNAGFIQMLWPQSNGFSPAPPDDGWPLQDPSTLDPNKGGNHSAGPGAFGPGDPNSPMTGKGV